MILLLETNITVMSSLPNIATTISEEIINTVISEALNVAVHDNQVCRELFPDEEPLSDYRGGTREQERIHKKIQELKDEGKYSRDFVDCTCDRCGDHYQDIVERIPGGRGSHRQEFKGDYLSVKDMLGPDGAELICQSCTIDEEHHYNDITPARWCVDCNVSNKLTDYDGHDMSDTGRLSGLRWHCYKCCVKDSEEGAENLGMDVEYDEDDPEKYSLPRVSCPQCGASSDEYCEHHPYPPPDRRFQEQGQVEEHSILCEECGREWDGNAQCPCGIGHFIDSSGDNEIATSWDQVSSWIEEYEGEYELAEDPPENNSEIAKDIKDSVKELGEQLFDLQEKLTEGEYLKMMNLLQKITNKTNSL
jgi:hypothetical protein